MDDLEGRNKEVFDFIVDYWQKHKFSPSLRDIMDGTSLTSTSWVNWHLDKLEESGYIQREPMKSRTITIVGAQWSYYG